MSGVSLHVAQGGFLVCGLRAMMAEREFQFGNKRLGRKHGRTLSSKSPRQGLWQGP